MTKRKPVRQEYNTTVRVCAHDVSVSYWGFKSKLTPELQQELTEAAEERAKEMIVEGYHSGELCHFWTEKEEEIRGWWEIED